MILRKLLQKATTPTMSTQFRLFAAVILGCAVYACKSSNTKQAQPKIEGGLYDFGANPMLKTKHLLIENIYGNRELGGSGGWLKPDLFVTALHVVSALKDSQSVIIGNGPQGLTDQVKVPVKELKFFHSQDEARSMEQTMDLPDPAGVNDAIDWALIKFPMKVAKPEDLLAIADKGVAIGDVLTFCGCANQPRAKKYGTNKVDSFLGGPQDGHTIKLVTYNSKATPTTVLAEGGDSGSPVLNSEGKLVGIVVSSSDPKPGRDAATRVANIAGMRPEVAKRFQDALPGFESPQYDAQNNPLEPQVDEAADTVDGSNKRPAEGEDEDAVRRPKRVRSGAIGGR